MNAATRWVERIIMVLVVCLVSYFCYHLFAWWHRLGIVAGVLK